MDTLDNFNYFMITALLNQKGFMFEEEISSNTDIWHNPNTNKKFKIKRTDKCMSKEALLDVLNQAGLTSDEFLRLI